MRQRPMLDDPGLRAWRDQTLYRLLLRAGRAETTETLRRIYTLGYTDVSLVDANLLSNLDTDGTTISALARRAGVTRQAIGQQASALERVGYVERLPSQLDGRAVVVVQTDRGRELLTVALDVINEIEGSYSEHLGEARMEELKELLTSLLEQIDPIGVLGRD